jgi:hypothetical protein
MKSILVLAALVSVDPGTQAYPRTSAPGIQMAATCFKTGEQRSGMTKICYYDCLGSPAAITVSSAQLCPLSISR